VKLTAMISLKDNYSAVMRRASQQTKSFQKDVEATKKSLDQAFKREQNIRIANSAANKAILQTIKLMKPLRDKAVVITAHTQMFWAKYNPMNSALAKVTKSAFVVSLKLKENVTSGLESIRNVLAKPLAVGAGVATAGAAAAASLGVAALKGASELELQKISMEHFIGINNKGKTQDQIKEISNQFLKQLIDNANITPFETGEVIKAGTRAVGIAAGDTKQAMNFVRLAEDMAALTPEKTISDAMEALADLKNGEVERMKEFNFKVTQAQIAAAGGKMENIKNAEGISLGQMFKGGAEKLGQSASGYWSTITGSIKTGITNMGVDTLELLKPTLKKWADYFSGPASDSLFKAGAKMMADLTKSVLEGAEKVTNWINTKFLKNVEFQNLPTFSAKVKVVWSEIKKSFDGWYETDGKKMLSGFLSEASSLLSQNASEIGKGAFDVGVALGKGIWDGFQDEIEKHPILTTLLTTAAGAAAGGSVGGLWGALIGGVAGLAGGAGISISVKTDPERIIKEQADFLAQLHSGDPNTPLISGPTTLSAPKKATGMRRVPFDNYPVLLHRNEQVLTAQEAEQNRKGKTPLVINLNLTKTDDPEANKILSILRAALEPVGYNMAPGGAQ
jgi:hypothetical protein